MRSSRIAACAALAVAAGLSAGVGTPRTQETSLDRVRWLAGCWELRRGERVTLEMWMPPAGGLMLGASRTVVAGVVRETEVLRIEERADGLVYIALPSGQRETVFTAGAVTDSGFTVSNPSHDFPQRITYRRRGADSLIAQIEGSGGDGTSRRIDFPMRRARCEIH